jgi:hypothetical protein
MNIIVFFVVIGAVTATMQTHRATDRLAADIAEALDEPVVPMPDGADNATIAVPEVVAEEQVATGKFTTALEVRPILEMTKAQWVAVRDYDGKDLLYFTNLLAWRCGLVAVSFTINDGPEEMLMMEPCYDDEATPNALKMETVLPYLEFPAGHIETVSVTATFDDLSSDTISVTRKDVLMP